MKLWVSILVLALIAQPLQAGACVMDAEKSAPASHAEAHGQPAEHASHDCCAGEEAEEQGGCDGQMNCAPCFLSTLALMRSALLLPSIMQATTPSYRPGLVPPSHASPPFRPPIS